MKARFIAVMFLLASASVQAGVVKGKIKDARTGEEIIGASVMVKEEPGKGTVTGLDGSFNLSVNRNKYTLVCSYIGYKNYELTVDSKSKEIEIPLNTDEVALGEVTVVASNPGRTEAGARAIERKAMNVVNVMSAKAIELSPDITVANVIQRMSGVTIERNSSGEGQYAILRGMDKRYNYTLVNGVKIPSPDNKNRFVPLDIFPSEMLDRLEVTKSLTANMEGDGIGGAVNLVMKDAPSERQFTASISTGYNAMYFDRDFQSFNKGAIVKESPYERMGKPEYFRVTPDDFNYDNLKMKWSKPLPDLTASLSYGDRFFGNRLGVMAAGTFLNTYRGKESQIYYQPGRDSGNIEYRNYSTQQTRIGAHLKLDYSLSENSKLTWYNGYMDMREAEVRDRKDDDEQHVRMKWNRQYVINSTLKGEHGFLDDHALRLDWSVVASKAYSETPDNAEVGLLDGGNRVAVNSALVRRWEHNSDRDFAGYLDLMYKLKLDNGSVLDFSAGGMYRDKKRDSYFNEYTFRTENGNPQIRGEEWNNYDEIIFSEVSSRNISGALNYDATEKIGAGYGMVKYTWNRWELIAGVRVEHTDQGYLLKFPTENADPEGNQKYTDVLPSFHAKYNVHDNANLRFSYARAINRPSFFEIVPYTIFNEDFDEKGNPDLKHTVADNIDLRYEFFPRSSEQFMVGLFYKRLENPIEYGLVNQGQNSYYVPMNFGNAKNMGVEIDIMKYFNWFGIKANYTYTHSKITTDKRTMEGSEVITVRQSRPLYGQAGHVANLSLLFKSAKSGWEGQIAGSYTGKRLSEVSNYFDDDIWEDGYFQLDASVEKSFRNGVSIFAKASNLLDIPLLRYTHKGPHTDGVTNFERKDGHLIERKEWHGQTIMLGVRYKL
ncbi:MAG: TonB-dependent receptor [Candidatus Phocaeicola excrementipullorum]|uniref:TonB-dependent receptor n=1 Tax=Candidatus Phocaeicola excrementipullorum TaxID=2838731 RepID=A0A948X3C9_9BACT|nr:TonB-dependent receptor [Candidatus Phocaeicola excrementipullorum]